MVVVVVMVVVVMVVIVAMVVVVVVVIPLWRRRRREREIIDVRVALGAIGEAWVGAVLVRDADLLLHTRVGIRGQSHPDWHAMALNGTQWHSMALNGTPPARESGDQGAIRVTIR